jgi:hypothetical protein
VRAQGNDGGNDTCARAKATPKSEVERRASARERGRATAKARDRREGTRAKMGAEHS